MASPTAVSIRYAPTANASCGFLLVVDTKSGVLAARIPEWYKPPQDLPIRNWWLPEPYLAAIVRLDPHGDQIVVARSEGAANKNVSLYGLVAGRLQRLLQAGAGLWREPRTASRVGFSGGPRAARLPGPSGG